MHSHGLVTAFNADLKSHILSKRSIQQPGFHSGLFSSCPAHFTLPFHARHFSPGFLVSLPSGCLPPLFSTLFRFFSLPVRLEPNHLHSALCPSSQFNHFSHFKMTLPQFYRSSRLSLPVSTATLLRYPPTWSPPR